MVLERDPVKLIALLRDAETVIEFVLVKDEIAVRERKELRDEINEADATADTEVILDLDGVIVGVDEYETNLLRVCVCDVDAHAETLEETNDVGEVDCETLLAVELVSDAETTNEGEFDPHVDTVFVINIEAELQPLLVSDGERLGDADTLLLLIDEALIRGDTVSLVDAVGVVVTDAHLVISRVSELEALVETD